MQSTLKIADLVQVRRHPTVVRLEDAARSDAAWIEEAYLLTDEVRRHLQGLRHALARETGTGIFLIGHYGAGKSHFLAYLQRRLRHGAQSGPEPLALSLLNFRAETPLEDILSSALGLEPGGADRRAPWEQVERLHPRGLLLMLDELSEFLRAKPTPQSFHEDIRYLQFLGEWAQSHRLWVLAAMQEQIEHTGDLEYGLYRKIKDRYPLRLLLSPAHVRELLADSILVKSEDYGPAVERLAGELREAFPDSRVDFADLSAIYPLHPATLALLEEVRDRFSSARGVVDFTVNQLLGNPERGIEPFLEQPWGRLLTPDYIVDHFHDLLEVQSEYLPLAQKLFPHYRKHMGELFPQPARQELAWRLLKLLVLVHLSPERQTLTPQQAAAWLLYRVTRVDPGRNLTLVHKTLEQLAADGRYVQRRGAGFLLNLADDSGAALERLLGRELAELSPTPAAVMETIVPFLGDDAFNPFRLARDRWQPRTLMWRFHPRDYVVYLGEGPPPKPSAEIALWLRLPWSEPATPPAPGAWTLQPAPLKVGEDLRELAALLRLSARVLAPEVKARVDRRAQERLGSVRGQLAQSYRDAVLLDPEGRTEGGFSEPGPRPFNAWLDACALWLLRRRFPAFERFAPSQGPLPREAYRQFLRAVQVLGLEQARSPQAGEFLDLVREGYLVPMGLLRNQGRAYQVPARLENHELIRLVQPLLEHQPEPATVYQHLAEPVYGLVPDQVHLLLLFLLIQGEIDLLKGGRSYRDLFETLPLPSDYERVVPARALSLDELKALEQLCEGLRLRTPGQWSVLAQRQMARRLRDLAAERRQALGALHRRLEEQPGGEALGMRIASHMALWRRLEEGEELAAVQQFLFEAGPVSRFLHDATELSALPERLERLLGETARLRHLFAQPPFSEGDWAARMEPSLEPPGLDRLEELEEWLQSARNLYQEYRQAYQQAHDAWWQSCNRDPRWSWQPPPLAVSVHLHLQEALQELEQHRREAYRLRCRGTPNLEFQTRCTCGFDGHSAPAEQELAQIDALRERIETRLERFFSQEQVRERVRDWSQAGGEVNEATQAYLRGEQPLPQITDLGRFDRHLAGVETVRRITAAELLGPLQGRIWSPDELQTALIRQLQGLKAERLRVEDPAAPADHALLAWMVEQSLAHALPLPEGLGAERAAEISRILRAEWATPPALAVLDRLGLGEAATGRLLGWLLDGTLPLPTEGGLCPSVAAVAEILRPTSPATPQALGQLVAGLYRQHERVLALAGERWLRRLQDLAATELPDPLPDLAQRLAQEAESSQWLVIDALGLPMLELLRRRAEQWLPHWRISALEFARVDPPTHTARFFDDLVARAAERPLEKLNALDRLLHQRSLPFADLERLADAELRASARAILGRLDPGRPLLVFADHGFRLARDGGGYVHGGASTLERAVPVARMLPLGNPAAAAIDPAGS
jgi:hypothetical protein